MRKDSFLFFLVVIFLQAHHVSGQKPDNPLIWVNEINAFAKADGLQMPEPGVILFTGSSSIRGWRSLKQDFPYLPVLNRGFGGSRIGDAIYYFDQLITKYRPEKVVFYSGENDIASGKDPEMVLDLFVKFANIMQEKLPETELIFLSIKPSIARWDMYSEMEEANTLIKEYISAHDWIKYVDVAGLMLGEDGKPLPEIFIGDKLHMNAQGYELWTEAVKPYLGR